MGKEVEPRERVIQRSFCIKNRQQEFLYWASNNIPEFDQNKLIRDSLDKQIEIFAPEYLENEQ